MCLHITAFQAIWKCFYLKYSSPQMSTLFQVKGLINRTGVPLDPSDNVKSPDFLLVAITFSHIIAAAKTILPNDSHIDCGTIIISR